MGHKASIEDAFVPLQLSDWRDDNIGSDDVPLNIEDLFINDGGENRFLVSGQPGGGKTTLMHYLAHSLASLAVEERREQIPVYVRLHDFCCTKKTLEEFVRQQINDECDSTEMYDMLCERGRFLEQSMVLLLDGLDEIEDHETNEKITGILNEFAMEYPRCRIIITSRPLGLKSDDYPRYQFLKLLPLDEGMVGAYLDRWFDGDRDKIAKLQTTFNGRPRIRALAANPFLLSMICFTFEQEGKTELVERRSQLYENCTRYLLERPYDNRKKSDRQFQYEEALSLLQELSLRFFLWQEADFGADHVNVIGKLHPTATSLGESESCGFGKYAWKCL